MATPVLNTVSKDLAYKLQDPVASGTTDGLRLSAAERFRYIIRSYRRLQRLVTLLYPTLIEKIFQSWYYNTTGTTTSSGVINTLTGVAEVLDVYAKRPTDEEYFRAVFITPDKYLDVETEQNSFYAPNINTDSYYWSREGDDVRLLPPTTLSYKLMYRTDEAAAIESAGQGGAYDITIKSEFLDLILALACAEAYMDIGQYDAAQAYKMDAQEQLAIIAGDAQKREVKDTDENP